MTPFEQAIDELANEDRRETVDRLKQEIRAKRTSLWSRLVRTIKTKKLTIKLEDKNNG